MMGLLLLPMIIRSFPGSHGNVLALLSAAGAFLQNLGALTWFGFRTVVSILSSFAGALETLARNETLRALIQVSAWTLLGTGFAVMVVSVGMTLLRDIRSTSSTLTMRDMS